MAKSRKLRKAFLERLCREVLLIDGDDNTTNADSTNLASRGIAFTLAKRLGASSRGRLGKESARERFEQACVEFLKNAFKRLSRPHHGKWTVARVSGKDLEMSEFEQHPNLREFGYLLQTQRQLSLMLCDDYFIKPDIAVFHSPEGNAELNSRPESTDEGCALLATLRKKNNPLSVLHASISCKWTIRSDRSQNSRSEALNLVRNRKGHTPHIVVVTAEPLPSRLASIALGTGDIDCVYHFALTELREALNSLDYPDAQDLLKTLVEGKRLRDISDLPLDLSV